MSLRIAWLPIVVLFGFILDSRGAEQCDPSESEIQALLAKDLSTFDQSSEGFRKYADRGCYELAAQLLERYLDESNPPEKRQHLLHFHAGQMWVAAEENDRALAHFKQSYKEQVDPIADWNSYVRATIAFFERDRDAVEAMREKLLEQPILTREEFPGLPEIWEGKRANLEVVNGFLACWNEPYQDAYHPDCREKYRKPDSRSNSQ